MMTNAYSELFVDDAMACLGEAFEYAVYKLQMQGQEFLDLFSVGRIGEAFSKGVVRYVSGMSGIELVHHILEEHTIIVEKEDYDLRIDFPAEYWCGWILAYFQWKTGKTFADIQKKLSFESLMNLYGSLHEAGEDKAVEVLNHLFEEDITNLAKMRMKASYSQSELAKEAGVSVRSIQMYEQKHNDIKNAQYNRLLAIAKALQCNIEDIVE